MAGVWVPALLLIVQGTGRLRLPFLVVLVIGAVACLAALKVACQLRAWVDPSFDADLSAHRVFPLASLRNSKG
jgi:hypothetical protein